MITFSYYLPATGTTVNEERTPSELSPAEVAHRLRRMRGDLGKRLSERAAATEERNALAVNAATDAVDGIINMAAALYGTVKAYGLPTNRDIEEIMKSIRAAHAQLHTGFQQEEEARR